MENQSTHVPPPPPEHNYGYQPSTAQKQAQQKPRTVPIVISGLTGLVLGAAVTLGMVAIRTGYDQEPANTQAGSDPSKTVEPSNETSATPVAAPSSPEATLEPVDDFSVSVQPTIEDFEIATSVKEQRCFGSAGCNVTIRTEPVYVGDGLMRGRWEVTYEITGIENGPVIRTFEVEDDQVSFDSEVRVSVPSETFDIKTEITEIREGFERR